MENGIIQPQEPDAQVPQTRRDELQNKDAEKSMMRHHLRALRSCIGRVRTAAGCDHPTFDAAKLPTDEEAASGHAVHSAEASRNVQSQEESHRAEDEATSLTELLMECSEALGILQVVALRLL